MNPLDRSTAYLEIAIIILISFLIGYIIGRIPLGDRKKTLKKIKEVLPEEALNPRDIISEPKGIMATLTRDREGKEIKSIDDAVE